MIAAALFALLVPLVRSASKFALTLPTTRLAAVFLASEVVAAYEENRRAEAAGELKEGNLIFHRDDADGKTGLVRRFRSI